MGNEQTSHSVHSPYSFPGGSVPPACRDGHEELLVDLAVRLLRDPEVNPFQCSIPAQRLQQRLKSKFRELYCFVVGEDGWKSFLYRHPDKFVVVAGERGRVQVRLMNETQWLEGEVRQAEHQTNRQHYLGRWLVSFLSHRPEGKGTVTDIVAAYNAEAHPFELPYRGDLIRFVIKEVREVRYTRDDKTFVLCRAGPKKRANPNPHPAASSTSTTSPTSQEQNQHSTSARTPRSLVPLCTNPSPPAVHADAMPTMPTHSPYTLTRVDVPETMSTPRKFNGSGSAAFAAQLRGGRQGRGNGLPDDHTRSAVAFVHQHRFERYSE